MSIPDVKNVGETTLDGGIIELSYAPNEYDQFRGVVKNVDTLEEWEKTWTDSSTSGTSTYKTFYGLDRASQYEFIAYATYNGVEYTAGDPNPQYVGNIFTYAEQVDDTRMKQTPGGVTFLWTRNSCDEYRVKVTDTDYNTVYFDQYYSDSSFDNDAGFVYLDNDIFPSTYAINVWGYENNISSKQGWGYQHVNTKQYLSTPGISVSSTGYLSFSGTDEYTVFEYEKVDTSAPPGLTAFDKTTRDYAIRVYGAYIETSLRYEGYSYHIERWNQRSLSVSITPKPSISSSELSVVESWVDTWASQASNYTGMVVSRVSSGGDIELIIGSGDELGFSETLNGTWSRSIQSDGTITSGTAKVRIDTSGTTFKHVIFEELTQALGPGADQYDRDDSLFQDLPLINQESISSIDGDCLELLYKHGIRPGMARADAAKLINARTAVYTSLSGYQLANLEGGEQYRIRAWAVDGNDNYSPKSNWITYTPPARPSNTYIFDALNNEGQDFDLKATEWNAFTSKINEFRVYKGLPTFNFINAVQYNEHSAQAMNQAANAIIGMSPPVALHADLINQLATGDDVLREHFTSLQDSLNSII